MTLLRQLLLSVTIAVVAILIGSLVFTTMGARDYLNAQLQADSDNAATSLALSLSQPVNQDSALRELLISALFDSGRFHLVELRDTDAQVLVSRQIEHAERGQSPAWFDRLLPLRPPRASRQVSDGWRQVGTLTVVADDSQARASLWSSTLRVLMWVVFAGLAWAAFVWWALRWVRTALQREIIRQVESVADGRPAAVADVPRRVSDLLPGEHVVAQARERVQASRQEATERIEVLTEELNHDTVTGLPNRRYFLNELRRALLVNGDSGAAPADRIDGGYLLLCRQRDLGALAAGLSRADVDDWLRSAGDQFRKVLADIGEDKALAGRLNGSDFALLLPAMGGPQAMLTAQAVRRQLLAIAATVRSRQPARWAFAVTDFKSGEAVTDVFARVDNALMKAESGGHGEIESVLRPAAVAGAAAQAASENQWRQLLTSALAEHTVSLSEQRVEYGPSHSPLEYFEASLSLAHPAESLREPLSGFAFMPAAARMGLSADFDLRAVCLACDWLGQTPDATLIVRMSLSSLLSSDFFQALDQMLIEKAEEAADLSRLIVELDAWSLSAYPADVLALSAALRSHGVRIGLRAVAQHVDVVARLQLLPLAYIKLGGGFLTELSGNQGALALANAIMHTATTLDLPVLVDDLLAEDTLRYLKGQGGCLRR